MKTILPSGGAVSDDSPRLTFGEAWDIQNTVGPSLDHDPKCSSVPGHHPLSGPALLCDCGAVEREWNRRSTPPVDGFKAELEAKLADTTDEQLRAELEAVGCDFTTPAERPTPITDAMSKGFDYRGLPCLEKAVDCSRDLERQLAEAREQRDECERQYQAKVEELVGVMEQCDRLAEAMKAIAPMFDNDSNLLDAYRDEITQFNAALAAVKETEPNAGYPSSDPCVGKTFTVIGYGGPKLRERVKAEGLVLWSVSQSKGHPDEFTHGWSGCDPGQLYFVENA